MKIKYRLWKQGHTAPRAENDKDPEILVEFTSGL
jgi:hypothetical protein